MHTLLVRCKHLLGGDLFSLARKPWSVGLAAPHSGTVELVGVFLTDLVLLVGGVLDLFKLNEVALLGRGRRRLLLDTFLAILVAIPFVV